MANSIGTLTVNVRIVGTGKSRFGLWLIKVIAKLYNIDLEVFTWKKKLGNK